MVWNDKLKREIPAIFKASFLGELCSFRNGINYAKDEIGEQFEIINVRNISSSKILLDGESFDTISVPASRAGNYIVKDNDIIIARSGCPGSTRLLLSPSNILFCGFIICCTPNEPVMRNYLTYCLKQLEGTSATTSGGSILQNVSQDTLKSLCVAQPTIDVLEKFNDIISSLFARMLNCLTENKMLIKQRDELLPLLMNGQVSVNYHLSASRRPQIKNLVIIMLAKTFITMKEQLIRDVVRQMSRHLDYKQQAILRETLNDALSGYNLVENDGNSQSAQENDALLDAFISAKSIEGCSDKTLRYYRSTISFLLADIGKAISAITTNDIRSYLANYQTEKQSSKVTIDNMRRIFSSFFAWLEDEDYILKSPVRRIHKVRTDTLIKEVFSDEHLELLRDSCTEIRDLAIIDLLASTGMRVGELVTLNRADVDMQERQCVVFGKGNKEREVYFNARTKIHLQQYLDTRRDDNPALFVSLHSPASRLTISGVEVRLRTLGANVNIGRVHPHKFRRTLATMAIDKGMPIEQVQKLLGHVKIDTTLHYAMVNQNNVKMAHRRFIS